MKILDSIWFSSRGGYCGLVVGEDELTGEKMAYIGVVSGSNEGMDTQEVAQWGCKVNLRRLNEIIKKHGLNK